MKARKRTIEMCYSCEVVTYSATNTELGELDKDVMAFLRVSLEYLTSFCVMLVCMGRKGKIRESMLVKDNFCLICL